MPVWVTVFVQLVKFDYMKRLEKYMPIAVDVVEDIILQKYKYIAPEWDNAVSRFGILVRQMGLPPAICAYSTDSGNSKVPKSVLTHCILRIILTSDGIPCERNKKLIDWFTANKNDSTIRDKVFDAIVALKLALRLLINKE